MAVFFNISVQKKFRSQAPSADGAGLHSSKYLDFLLFWHEFG
ncbi:MAG: hypothetical protein UT48_C0017G0025 [Parcubacteria group bacterium GW2011_GWE2_39_37]|uniref:Uncharacterized protein n=1 Tax=Candidatus Falkowbacteria bacterium GW2011_GWF2_39_8 TaxID=1618642 RepID=A0A0G0Q7T5_9BACT|nr:MAG: hypothetical protein UT48_C0017G0025 [Parcubacteria group bacterium GW2011_GWE2_39_37]KKR33396.1 MAG: hypothetical protein UT64_C0009G0008 [Candidatus Falkowbacteria bacterium GW2011_GWF2_39_8]